MTNPFHTGEHRRTAAAIASFALALVGANGAHGQIAPETEWGKARPVFDGRSWGAFRASSFDLDRDEDYDGRLGSLPASARLFSDAWSGHLALSAASPPVATRRGRLVQAFARVDGV